MNSILSSFLNNRNNVQNLNSEAFEQNMKNDKESILIDVRTRQEFLDVKIPNAILIDLMDPHFIHEIEKLDKSKSYYIYCRSGNRSYYACKQMLKLGFKNVYNLAGGIIEWKGEIER